MHLSARENDAETGPLHDSWRMSRGERLHRWAELLDLEDGQCLQLVDDTGAAPDARNGSLRADNSPLSVAFEDWALRAEGLHSDRLADASAFFELSEAELQSIVGAAHHGRRALPAVTVADCVRSLAHEAGAERRHLPRGPLLAAGASLATALALMLAT